jgi:hypothetical protein
MFVAVTVVAGMAGWASYESRIALHRIAARTRLESLDAYVLPKGNATPLQVVELELRAAGPGRAISPIRRCMGDGAISAILFARELTPLDQELIEEFPEARIVQIPSEQKFFGNGTDY